MSLLGSIAKLQSSAARLYLEIAQYFEANDLIRSIWLEMAHDQELQVLSLETLPPSFWKKLKGEEKSIFETLRSCTPLAECSKEGEHSLRKCLSRTLEFEQPVILKVYVPLIRQLRMERTNQALDFYIMIKAHVAKLSRLIQSFSGDPILARHAGALLQSFEKDVQTHEAQSIPVALIQTHHATSAKLNKAAVAESVRLKRTKTSNLPRSRGARSKGLSPRSKPLSKSLDVRRRARV